MHGRRRAEGTGDEKGVDRGARWSGRVVLRHFHGTVALFNNLLRGSNFVSSCPGPLEQSLARTTCERWSGRRWTTQRSRAATSRHAATLCLHGALWVWIGRALLYQARMVGGQRSAAGRLHSDTWQWRQQHCACSELFGSGLVVHHRHRPGQWVCNAAEQGGYV